DLGHRYFGAKTETQGATAARTKFYTPPANGGASVVFITNYLVGLMVSTFIYGTQGLGFDSRVGRRFDRY
ncbi:jg10863, partial [Pararge aegeria aegeria]